MDEFDEMSDDSESSELFKNGSKDILAPRTRELFKMLNSDFMRAMLQNTTYKPFKIDCYLDESYSFKPYPTEGIACAAAILTAILNKDFKVIDLCLWTLATFKKNLAKDTDGEPCSFVQRLGAKALIFSDVQPAYPTDPAMEEWVLAASTQPEFEVFILALAMFVAGFTKRKSLSQENQLRDGKWRHSLAAMTSLGKPLPRKLKLNFLKGEDVLAESQKRALCGACLFLEATTLGKKLREPTIYGVVRPICDNHTLLPRRFQEFKRLYPEAFFRDSSFPRLPLVQDGLKAIQRLEKVLNEAKEAEAELQPLMIRSIDRGYLIFLGDSGMKQFQIYLFFCICNRKGRRGRENWQALLRNNEKTKKTPLTYLNAYNNWVSSLRVE